MSDKYIIKNCPACHNYFSNIYECHQIEDCDDNSCSSYTDCVMKQIVDLCENQLNSLETYVDIRSLECVTLQNILKLLDIQEVE